MKCLYHVSVGPGLDYDCLADEALHLKKGDEVIVRCDRYQDIGTVSRCNDSGPVDEKQAQEKYTQSSKGRRIEGQRIPRILRRATLVDKSKAHENEVRARSMQRSAADQIARQNLPMKLVSTHYSFDKRLVVFQFSAEGRIDFRELLRDLSRELHTRVELRQIGVRDEAGIQGGIGACGRAFCCSTFLKRFVSINVKMAKQQGLSLNPATISGACGRLKCCLNYESDWYRECERERLRAEKENRACRTPDGPGIVATWDRDNRKALVTLDDPAGEKREYPLDKVQLEPLRRRPNDQRREEG
ncbi:MAG: hypothetical protein HN742_06460 [Lentisphaerae bacterium]|jgi:cell fate regulator YaaT (PSP1 superfamily)|nr:hypothetical protein [Lentisphaerota bacterium]MBT4819965.1 hypothetical protein [Lentisphaerota bacterium]MBT5610049.1 hypothetical protein [Lentisphaerota bacterium]MBT7055551.1 hypothetical protein [Lentisphaerota bacterium]MBT7841494.1 hypothetical protein [Lentisphaerota bacterium]